MNTESSQGTESITDNLTIKEMFSMFNLTMPTKTAENRLINAGIYKTAAYAKSYQTAMLTRDRLRAVLTTPKPPMKDNIETHGMSAYRAGLDVKSINNTLDKGGFIGVQRNKKGGIIKK